jgi:flagellar biosynthesis protein FlhA
MLAVSGGAIIHPVAGIPATDPVFKLDAVWIDPAQREAAERGGYTAIEPSAVLSTHLAEIAKAHAGELLTRQDVQSLVDNAKRHNEAAVSELIPNVLQVGDVQKVLQHLLRERVPIRDMAAILETMADFGTRIKDPEQLGELVRASMGRTITRQYLDDANKLHCITLEPQLERSLAEQLGQTAGGAILALDPDAHRQLLDRIRLEIERATGQGFQAVLLCSNQLRLPLWRIVDRQLPGIGVLAYNEVAESAEVEFVGQIPVSALAQPPADPQAA